MVPSVTGLNVFHLYRRNGDIEYICKSCLDVLCSVRRPEDALIHQRNHICGSEERTVDTGKVI
jgi:hypothetical protein